MHLLVDFRDRPEQRMCQPSPFREQAGRSARAAHPPARFLDNPPKIRAQRNQGAEQSHNPTHDGPPRTLMRQHRSALYTGAISAWKQNVIF